MRNLKLSLLSVLLLLSVKSYSKQVDTPSKNTENNSYNSLFGHKKLMANENNNGNTNENEEVCDQELVHITANYGNNFYVLCLETDEDNRITGFRYNTYHEETEQFIKSKSYNGSELGLYNCTNHHSNEAPHEISLANRNFQASLDNATQNDLSRSILGIRNNNDDTTSENCISNQTINIGSKFGFRALYFQTSYFNFYQGGDLYFTYLSSPFDHSYEQLGLRLSKYEDRWILSDIENQRVMALSVEMNRSWLVLKMFPTGINNIRPIYEDEKELEGSE